MSIAKLRWILLGLYVVLLVGLGGTYILASSGQALVVVIGLCAFHLVSQLVFILVPGSQQYLVPIGPRRLLVPVLLAALLTAGEQSKPLETPGRRLGARRRTGTLGALARRKRF